MEPNTTSATNDITYANSYHLVGTPRSCRTSISSSTISSISVDVYGRSDVAAAFTTGRDPNSTQKELAMPNRTIPGLYFETGDMLVTVAGTHVFRLHQEILASHSTFFREVVQVSVDSNRHAVPPRPEDLQVVDLRDISLDAFVDVLRLIYPPPNAIRQPCSRDIAAEQLLRTSHSLGMAGIIDFAMDILSTKATALKFYWLTQIFSLTKWKVKPTQEFVYRTRPLDNDEANVVGVLAMAQISRLRENFRARIFARFEPVMRAESAGVNSQPHRAGKDLERAWSGAGKGQNLGPCQQAILEALKLVFDVDKPKSELEQFGIRSEASIMSNLANLLRLGGIKGGVALCNKCVENVEKLVKIYCKQDEMDAIIKQVVTGGVVL